VRQKANEGGKKGEFHPMIVKKGGNNRMSRPAKGGIVERKDSNDGQQVVLNFSVIQKRGGEASKGSRGKRPRRGLKGITRETKERGINCTSYLKTKPKGGCKILRSRKKHNPTATNKERNQPGNKQ